MSPVRKIVRLIVQIFLFGFLSNASFAENLEIKQFNVYKPIPSDEVLFFAGMSDGGFLMFGRTRNRQIDVPWIEQWKPNLSILKRKILANSTNAIGLDFFSTSNKFPISVGASLYDKQENEYTQLNFRTAHKALLNINDDLSFNVIASIESLVPIGVSIVECVIQDGDSQIISGWKDLKFKDVSSTDGPTSLSVPWVARIGKTGIEWERAFTGDSGQIFTLSMDQLGRRQSCDQELIREKNGDVVAVFRGRGVEFKDGPDGKTIDGKKNNVINRNFVVKVNSRGNEIARWHSDGEAEESLMLKGDNGYVLIDNYRFKKPIPQIEKPSNDDGSAFAKYYAALVTFQRQNHGGIRFTSLDNNLKSLNVVESMTDNLNQHLQGVVRTKNGDFFVLGCQYERGVSLAYLSNKGTLIDVKRINPNPNEFWCNTPGIALEAEGNDAIFLVGQSFAYGARNEYGIYRATLKK